MKKYLLGMYEKAADAQWDWPEKLARAAQAGFDFIEMSVDETPQRQERLLWSAARRKEFARTVNGGIPVSSMCLSAHRKYPLGSRFKEVRDRGINISEAAIELAYDLGIRIIQLAGYDVYYNESSDSETKKYFTENLYLTAKMAASRGVLLGLETMENDFMNTVEKAMEYVRKVNSPYLQMYPDTGNITNATPYVKEDLQTGQGHIISAHLKETAPGLYRNLMFGEGHVDFKLVTQCLINMNVSRLTAEFWNLPGRDAQTDMKAAYAFLNALLKNTETEENYNA